MAFAFVSAINSVRGHLSHATNPVRFVGSLSVSALRPTLFVEELRSDGLESESVRVWRLSCPFGYL
jgi:hypothetical protein